MNPTKHKIAQDLESWTKCFCEVRAFGEGIRVVSTRTLLITTIRTGLVYTHVCVCMYIYIHTYIHTLFTRAYNFIHIETRRFTFVWLLFHYMYQQPQRLLFRVMNVWVLRTAGFLNPKP